ncbi:hypothetical protein [Rhodococcus sp. NPDC057529]|uniref:hypothetical protein n=1 Tax=Rhodococcus sp. NPDC057529 TaxID=3346158 RepID=UPI00366B15C9
MSTSRGGTPGADTVGEVAELTDRLPHLATWPHGLRVFVRRVKPLRDTTAKPLPGVAAQLELDGGAEAADNAVTGWRYELFATNTEGGDTAWLDARHRKHARVEDRIRCGKQTGAAKYPFREFAANTAWVMLHGVADYLLAWTRLLACDGSSPRPNPRHCRTGSCTRPPRSPAAPGAAGSTSLPPGRGPTRSWRSSPASRRCPDPANDPPSTCSTEPKHLPGQWNPAPT